MKWRPAGLAAAHAEASVCTGLEAAKSPAAMDLWVDVIRQLLLRECREKGWELCGANNCNPRRVEAEESSLAEQE